MLSIYGDDTNGYKVYVVSDLPTDIETKVLVSVEDFNGQWIIHEEVPAKIKAYSS